MKLDVPRWAAYKIAYCGDRYARLAHNGWVQKGYKYKETNLIWISLNVRLLHRKVCYLLS